jgi:hypothetical protein
MSRGFTSDGPGEVLTLTRINVADRSSDTELQIPVTDYDRGVMALDTQDVLWMGWGETLMRFDPDTGVRKSWTRPAFSGLARVYSMDGRMTAMTIDSNGEVWVAASMLSAVFEFDPKSETWQRPINLTFVPGGWGSVLAAPVPGIITINGGALAGGAPDPRGLAQFAVISTATRTVKTLDLPVVSYVMTGAGQIVYADGSGHLVQLKLPELMSTLIASATEAWATSPALMAADIDRNVWIPATTGGFPGVTKLNPSTGSLTQFPFPVVVVYYERRPTPSPVQCSMPHSCMPVVCRTILVFRCTPTAVSLDPGVQQMAPDADGNVWMVNSASSTTLQGNRNPMAPVVELEANSP